MWVLKAIILSGKYVAIKKQLFNSKFFQNFPQQTEGMFNTGGKNDVSKGWEKSCKNMSKNFDSMSKSLDKILGYIDTLVFTAAIDKKRSDFVSFKLAVQAYKTLFDAFGSSAGSTGSKPNPTELMATINAAFAALNTLA